MKKMAWIKGHKCGQVGNWRSVGGAQRPHQEREQAQIDSLSRRPSAATTAVPLAPSFAPGFAPFPAAGDHSLDSKL